MAQALIAVGFDERAATEYRLADGRTVTWLREDVTTYPPARESRRLILAVIGDNALLGACAGFVVLFALSGLLNLARHEPTGISRAPVRGHSAGERRPSFVEDVPPYEPRVPADATPVAPAPALGRAVSSAAPAGGRVRHERDRAVARTGGGAERTACEGGTRTRAATVHERIARPARPPSRALVLMVASIGAVASPAQGVSYYEKDSDEHRAASAWAGKGAAALGLEGPVDPDTFRAVLEGEVPDGSGRRLGKRGKEGEIHHRPGRDLTFSAPKSVSLAALVGGDGRIVEAHDRAVVGALDWFERNAAETRMQAPGGGGMVRADNQKTVDSHLPA